MIRHLSATLAGLVLSVAALAVPSVEMQTSQGKIVIEFDATKAPKTVENFLKYAKSGHYDGTIFTASSKVS